MLIMYYRMQNPHASVKFRLSQLTQKPCNVQASKWLSIITLDPVRQLCRGSRCARVTFYDKFSFFIFDFIAFTSLSCFIPSQLAAYDDRVCHVSSSPLLSASLTLDLG